MTREAREALDRLRHALVDGPGNAGPSPVTVKDTVGFATAVISVKSANKLLITADAVLKPEGFRTKKADGLGDTVWFYAKTLPNQQMVNITFSEAFCTLMISVSA